MGGLDGDRGFDDWFDATFSRPGDDAHRELVEAFRTWAQALYPNTGPIGRDVVMVALHFDQLAVVEAALAMVIADLSVASERVPTLDVDFYEGIRITVDGGYGEPSVDVPLPFDVSAVAVEIVEYIREQLSQDRTVTFPVCEQHEGFYLHPELENGVAVWRCRRGGHVVAPIGRPGEAG